MIYLGNSIHNKYNLHPFIVGSDTCSYSYLTDTVLGGNEVHFAK